MLTNGQFKVK